MARDRQLPIRLDNDVNDALEELAASTEQSLGTIVRAALRHFFRLPAEERRKILIGYVFPDEGDKGEAPRKGSRDSAMEVRAYAREVDAKRQPKDAMKLTATIREVDAKKPPKGK